MQKKIDDPDEIGMEFSFNFDFLDPAILQFVEERAFDFWESISETTKAQVTRVINEGLASGATIQEISESLSGDVFSSLTADDFGRARRIARTETGIAMGQASYQGGKQTKVKLEKSWMSNDDSVVRTSHIQAEAEGAIPYDAKFTSTNMLHPHDPAGDVKELVNCRCALLNEVPKEEARRVNDFLNKPK